MDLFIEDYFSKIVLAPKTVFPYITQSWLNYIEMNGSHHIHNHPNSYVSGVLYINADKTYDQITFSHGKYDRIKLGATTLNAFNSETWSYPVGSGEIVIFPSHLNHEVAVKKGKNSRISLSFNVFVKGTLGHSMVGGMIELKL